MNPTTTSILTNASSYTILSEGKIEKPDIDHREYKYIELNNKLRVLLISDPTTDKSAAALNVHVGYYADPEDLPGLAHFLEHLLFMGTEKYPNENEYSEYLSSHHGSSNAYTSHSQTNYYFEVNSQFLHGALDRFSQFFIAPLFSESCTERELLAVDSEHKNNLLKDYWRLAQLHKHLCPKSHPYSKFGTGNLDTLRKLPLKKKINVRNELIKFYHRYYSANLMRLVILGKENLTKLTEWATSLFASIPNQNQPVFLESIKTHPWDGLNKENINQWIKVKSLKDLKSLQFIWKIPNSPDWWDSKPAFYLAHLLGHEGRGSILSLLKSKGWAMNLAASTTHVGIHFDFFKIQIDLTDEGVNHMEDILVIVFQYLHLLKTSPLQEWIFKEIQMLRELNFKFKEVHSMSSYVVEVAEYLQEPFPFDLILKAASVPLRWDPKLIQFLLTYLTTNVQLMFSASNLPSNVVLDSKEPYYGTEYQHVPISPALLNKLEQCGSPNPSELFFPNPNPFIPRDLTITKHTSHSEAPSILHATSNVRVWYLRDPTFWVPQAYFTVAFQSPLLMQSCTNHVLSSLLSLYIKDAMMEFIYDATLVGMDVSIQTHSKALKLTLYGMCEKLDLIVSEFVTTLMTLPLVDQHFDRLKKDLLRKLENVQFDPPYSHSLFYVKQALQRPLYSPHDQVKALQPCTKEMFVSFVQHFCQSMFMETLYVGNAPSKWYLEWVQRSLRPLTSSVPLPLQLDPIQLPFGVSKYRHVGKDPLNSAVTFYVQIGDVQDYHLASLLGLFVQLTQDQAFHQLRTEKQLGYIVFSNQLTLMNTKGYFILVQSEQPADQVEWHMKAFLEYVKTYLETLSMETYQSHVLAYVAKLLEKPKSLMELAELQWNFIFTEHYTFHAFQLMADLAQTHSLEDVRAFFLKYIHPSSSNARAFCSHYVSSQSKLQEDTSSSTETPWIPDLVAWVGQQKKWNLSVTPLPSLSHSV